MLMAVGLLISTTMSAEPAKVALAREASSDMPQVEMQQMAEPQPYAMVAAQESSMRKAPKKVALSTEAITDDQVTLEVNGVQVGTTYSIVDAFKYVNANCSATDSAAITLQKNIDLAYADWQSTSAGVSLAAGKKATLNLNGFNFTSSINTGTGWGNDDGKGTCLIQNNGIMYIQDNTFDASTADLLPENNLAPTQHAIIFFEETPDVCKNESKHKSDHSNPKYWYPHYASDAVDNLGQLTISNCKILNNSNGSAAYCIDHRNSARNISLWVESGYLFSKYCNAVRQYITSGKYTNNFTLDGGVLVGGGACMWTQFNNGTGTPTSETNFLGGKCIAGYGAPDPSKSYYSYANYNYGAESFKNVKINISGTQFSGIVYLVGNNTVKGEGLAVNILDGIYDNEFCLEGNDITLNIYDGVFNGIVDIYGEVTSGADNIVANIHGGTFNNSVYSYCANSNVGNTINIYNGEFSGQCFIQGCNKNQFVINGGTFRNYVYMIPYTYYLPPVQYTNYNYPTTNNTIKINGGTFNSDIMLYLQQLSSEYAWSGSYGFTGDYLSEEHLNNIEDNNKIIVNDGFFAGDIYASKMPHNSSIEIKGGYFVYDSNDGYSYCNYGCDYANDWTTYVVSPYTKIAYYNEEQQQTYWPVTDNDGYYGYYWKIGQENKTPADIDENGKIVIPDGEGGTREPEPTDNIIITNDNPEGEGEYGRDTIYLDQLNVNGITFAGRDTIDVIAKPGSVVIVGSSGIKASDTTTVYMTVEGGGAMKVGVEAIQKVDTIIVESDNNGNGTLLISPNAQLTDAERFATVRLYVDGACKVDDTYYIWQHVAVPTDGTGTFTVENDRKATDPGFKTHVQWWDQALTSEDKWHQINAWEEMNKPWQGFILTTNSTTPGVTYSFTGNIIGNNDGQLYFDAKGYNFFGNSFTAPINVQTMLNGISNGEDIEMTVWIYSADKLRYLESNNLMRLLGRAEFDQISSMQGFWLRNMTNDFGQNASVNYTNAVWNNPGAMGNPKVKAPAHRQVASEMGLSTAQIIVSNDSREDKLLLVEGSEYTERFDNGSDASKMIDANSFNIYATTTAGDLACVATDELAGTMLSFKAIEAGEYTMSFANMAGKEYVIYDMMTGRTIKMTEGGSFTFVAEAGLSEGRFMISYVPGSATEMEKVQNTSAIKGVYNMLGQYVANTADWSKLAAGIYVVDGVKVIK